MNTSFLSMDAFNTLDFVIFGFLLWSLIRGFFCGFVRSLITPIGMLAGFYFAMMNYDLTNNLIEAAMVFTGVTVGVALALRLLLWIGRLGLDEEQRRQIPAISRISGAVINTVWNGSLVLILCSVADTSLKGTLPPIVTSQLDTSRMIRFAEAKIMPAVPVLKKTQQTLTVITDPKFSQSLAGDPDLETFRNNPVVKDVLNDQQIQTLIAEKKYIDLLRHPKVRRLLEDDALMRDFSQAVEKHYKKSLKKN